MHKSTPAKFHKKLTIDNIQITWRLFTLNSKLKFLNLQVGRCLLSETKMMVGLKDYGCLGFNVVVVENKHIYQGYRHICVQNKIFAGSMFLVHEVSSSVVRRFVWIGGRILNSASTFATSKDMKYCPIPTHAFFWYTANPPSNMNGNNTTLSYSLGSTTFLLIFYVPD